MGKPIIINGKKKVLQLSIDDVSVNIYIDNGEQEPTHVAYWHLEEVEEDASVGMAMINAVHLYHTDPQELIDRLRVFRVE